MIEGAAGYVLQQLGRTTEARELLRAAYAAVDDGSDDEAVADTAARLSAVEFQLDNNEESLRLADIALRIADGRRLDHILVRALISKGNVLAESGRPAESTALLTHAVALALDLALPVEAASARFNLADNVMMDGRFTDALDLLGDGIALARRRGDRQGERRLLAQSVIGLIALGRWDEALDRIAVVREGADDIWAQQAFVALPYVLSGRGDIAAMEEMLEPLATWHGWPALETQAKLARALILRDHGRPREALPDVQMMAVYLATSESQMPFGFAEAVDCAFAAEAPEAVDELLRQVDALKPAQVLPLLDAEAARARARLAAHRGDPDDAARSFRHAIHHFRELGTPFCLARAQLEYAELLGGNHDEAAALVDEAMSAFRAVGAKLWLERAEALGSEVPA
jgi:tetratricopeptide (TPR) repeat protein